MIGPSRLLTARNNLLRFGRQTGQLTHRIHRKASSLVVIATKSLISETSQCCPNRAAVLSGFPRQEFGRSAQDWQRSSLSLNSEYRPGLLTPVGSSSHVSKRPGWPCPAHHHD